MSNQGLQFEWCIFHQAISKNKLALKSPSKYNKVELLKAAETYRGSPKNVKDDAKKAIDLIEKKFGSILSIQKMSGGSPEPKTDLIITCSKKKIKCSLKYGGAIQLSSAGITTTVRFLEHVIKSISKMPGYNKEKATKILALLSQIDLALGSLGKLSQEQANTVIGKAQGMNTQLQEILGSSKNPEVSTEYEKIKLAIVEEAITGKLMFQSQKDKAADHILSELGLFPINEGLVKSVAKKTSVRLALKGRGKETIGKKVVRLNEIVVRFDTKG